MEGNAGCIDLRALERLRQAGQLDTAERWIDDLRRVLPRPKHSFFL